MTPDRERLKAAIDARVAELGLRFREVASRARMSETNFYRIRTGEIELTDTTRIALEDALQWERGSIQAILDGGEPTLSAPSATPAAVAQDAPEAATIPAGLPLAVQAVLRFGTLVGEEVFTINLDGEEVKIGVFATSKSALEKLVDQYERLGKVTGQVSSQVKRTFESGEDESTPDSTGGAGDA